MPSGGLSNTSRCWVPGCINNKIADRLNSTVQLFRFPCANVSRCRKWLKFVGSEVLLSYNPDQLKNKAVCDAHFRDYEIRKNNIKTTLVSSAVPSKFPPGVCPLPDELVEQWPRQNENHCGKELDLSVCQLQSPLSMSTLGPLKERETNLTRQVQAGGSPQVVFFEPDSGIEAPHKIHPGDDSSDDEYELLDYVLYRRKKDGSVRAFPAVVRVESRPKVIRVQ